MSKPNQLLTKRGIRLLILLMMAILALIASLSIGAVKVNPMDIVSILTGHKDVDAYLIIWNIRLPRVLIAALVGMGLALSGTILQGMLQNPMADPHVIGISSGAGVAGIGILLALPQYGHLLVPAAFAGAVVAALIIYMLGWKNGMVPVRLILSGVAVSAFLNSGISALLTFYSDRVEGALSFMVGSLSAKSWPHVEVLWPYILPGAIAACLCGRWINIMQLGEATAISLGLRLEWVRVFLLTLASLLAAAAVSVAGLLGFVGLIVPHLAKLIIGSDYRWLLPCSAVLGVVVLETSDLISRMIFSPVELPVGIIMGAIGAPFFLYLLRTKR
ncbi:corrinoid ABC transporter permease [Paenibacillus sp. J23TS9]|uniref:FecCD family ABC transporter permease n=1 Tax=Paenibacillus sp. J23TS9 TaxID=2807193 RepID=UPI001B112B32|nr:iron ABC transporter permease [Paenibacillus sp. J23TS9]GIP26137.1 corrinoid ABC transporter permease [Paenibacillus sp. J23TS9]